MPRTVDVDVSHTAVIELAALDGYTSEPAETMCVVERYWDTHELRLLSWGVTARHRSGDGALGWLLEIPHATDPGAREQIELTGDEMMPPERIDVVTRPYVGNESLRPVVTVTTQRSRTRLHDRSGNTVELTIDHVESTIGRSPGPSSRQFRLELVHGDEHALEPVRKRLRGAGLRQSAAPTLATLLGERRSLPPAPFTTRRLRRDSTVEELAQVAFASSERLVRHVTRVQLGDDQHDVHQARVATRRLRSDLRALRDLLDPTMTEHLRSELRWLARLLGEVRDRDVLTESAVRVSAGLDDAHVATLAERLHDERRLRVMELRDALTSGRYSLLTAQLTEAAVHPPLRRDVRPHRPGRASAERFARHAWRDVRNAAKGLGDDPEDRALHELRRKAKRARYAYELLGPALRPKRARRRAALLADLQSELGHLQDAVVARSWLDGTVDARTAPAAAYAAGLLACRYDHERRRARRSWQRAWRKVQRSRSPDS